MGVRGHADPPADGLGGSGPQPLRVTTRSYQPQLLGHAHVAGVGFGDALAERIRVTDEVLGVVEPAIDERECAATGRHQVVVVGLAQLLGRVQVLGQRRAERGRAFLQQRVGGEQQPVRVPLGVPGAFGELRDLPGDADPLRRAARRPQHVVAGEQTGVEGLRVVDPASQVDRLLGQRPRPRPLFGHRVVQLAR
jgi:hypothetical protein